MRSIRGRFTSHRDAVQDMKTLDAVEYLLGVIENANMDNCHSLTVEMNLHGFTPQEAILLNALIRANEAVCNREHLMDAICCGRREQDLPLDKIIDVRICGIRKKLPEGFSIQNVRSVGYRLVRERGALLPWEAS